MEELMLKQNVLIMALVTLDEAIILLHDPKYQEIYKSLRDSLIQRFEYSIDGFWKFLKFYMQEKMNICSDLNTPRSILREAVNAQVVSEVEFKKLIDAIADRNLTSHTYREKTAQSIADAVPGYYETMWTIVERLKI